MKLKRLRLRNFRCYKDFAIDFDDLTAIIGKNDAGKSSVLDALDLFLNENNPDKDDACKQGTANDLAIICEFEDLPREIIVDDAYPTNFAEEFLLNEHNRLEVHKIYSGQLATPKCSGVFLYACHPTSEGVNDLLQLKNADLKKRAENLGIDLGDVDPKINAHVRKKIRESVRELELQPVLIPVNDANAKRIWDGLKKYLPGFALFKSDRASTDQDPEAQDPVKMAVKEAIKNQEGKLDEIFQTVAAEVKKVADKTLEKLQEMDPNLAQELNPRFSKPKWENLFKAGITGDDEIPINKRGSGVKRLILLNFFRAKAELEAQKKNTSNVIYAIEEPETSQHPNNQRILVRALMDLADDTQVILTTHTPVLVRSISDTNLRYIHINDNGDRVVLNGGASTNDLLARSLGVLPDHSVKLFIGVEGKHDIAFLKHIAKVFRSDGVDVLDLEQMENDGEIIFFPLGGSNLALWCNGKLQALNRPEFHLFDRDNQPPLMPKYHAEAAQVNSRQHCKAIITGKKEMENYIHKDAIIQAYAAYNITISLASNFGDFDDVPVEVAKLVHNASGSSVPWSDVLNDKEKLSKKESRAKTTLNSIAVANMTKDMIDEIDSSGDLLNWFTEMEQLIQSSTPD